MYLDSL